MNENNYSLEELGLLKYYECKTSGYGLRTPLLTYETIEKDTGKDNSFVKCYTWCLVRKKQIRIEGDLSTGAVITLTGELIPKAKTAKQKMRKLLDGLTETQKTLAKLMLLQMNGKNNLGEPFDSKASDIKELMRGVVGMDVPDEEIVVAIETLRNGGVVEWSGSEWVYGSETKRLMDGMNGRQRYAFFRLLNNTRFKQP